jgi:5-methylcytosine-specific restriction protein A
MTRSVPEWVAKHDDQAIPPRVKVRVFDRQGGKCATCNRKMGMAGEAVEYDHIMALVNGGEHREANLQALCGMCHVAKTRDDMAVKKKTARVRKKHIGLSKPKRKMPYRKFDGTPVWPQGE